MDPAHPRRSIGKKIDVTFKVRVPILKRSIIKKNEVWVMIDRENPSIDPPINTPLPISKPVNTPTQIKAVRNQKSIQDLLAEFNK